MLLDTVQKRCRLLWAWGIWDGPSHSGNVHCGHTNQCFRYLLGEMDALCSKPRKKRIIQTVTSNKSKSQGRSWYGVVSVPLEKVTCPSMMAPLMLKSSWRFWSRICCLQEDGLQKKFGDRDQMTPETLHRLVSSVSKSLLSIVKRNDVLH